MCVIWHLNPFFWSAAAPINTAAYLLLEAEGVPGRDVDLRKHTSITLLRMTIPPSLCCTRTSVLLARLARCGCFPVTDGVVPARLLGGAGGPAWAGSEEVQSSPTAVSPLLAALSSK